MLFFPLIKTTDFLLPNPPTPTNAETEMPGLLGMTIKETPKENPGENKIVVENE